MTAKHDTAALTREQILAMEPGRELDKLVAEKVMGFTVYHYDKDVEANCYFLLCDGIDAVEPLSAGYDTEEAAWVDCPLFSTDISAAWEAWEHDHPEHWHINLFRHDGKYLAEIIEVTEEMGYQYLAQVESESAAEAMVKCRLLAVMGI